MNESNCALPTTHWQWRDLRSAFLALTIVAWVPNTSAQTQASTFADGIEFGRIVDERIAEASGIAASGKNPGVLWVHNDGSSGRLYAISSDGTLLATYQFEGKPNDIEDIAIGPGPIPGIQYIYAGDIGDNSFNRDSIQIYRIPEPSIYPYFTDDPISENLKGAIEIKLEYPDGSHDSEALMIDSQTGDLFIATKELGFSQVFRAARAELESGDKLRLTLVQEIPTDRVSAADISPDGGEILIRSESIALHWTRSAGQSIGQALGEFSTIAPLIGPPSEPNGEGIAFDPDGLGYYTLSEGLNQPLYFFERIRKNAPANPVVLIREGDQWNFLDDGRNQGFTWKAPDFNDGFWKTGLGQFGYGEHDERTKLLYGNDPDQKNVTTYFRKFFEVEDTAQITALNLDILYDDGIAVYLNGTEVLRSNLAPGAPFSEPATTSNSDLENIWITYGIPMESLRTGQNLIAIEVHRRSRSEGDLSFDARLLADLKPRPLRFSTHPALVATHWQFSVEGPAGLNVTIQGSSDLVNWIAVGTLALDSGTGTFVDPRNAKGGHQFFRLRR
ncbi:MAG: hypothetical protein O2960_03610 [Verrucomicrobia bacterium]|nr:hypothetical protein [Verrucomicrobiota bacterium]